MSLSLSFKVKLGAWSCFGINKHIKSCHSLSTIVHGLNPGLAEGLSVWNLDVGVLKFTQHPTSHNLEACMFRLIDSKLPLQVCERVKGVCVFLGDFSRVCLLPLTYENWRCWTLSHEFFTAILCRCCIQPPQPPPRYNRVCLSVCHLRDKIWVKTH